MKSRHVHSLFAVSALIAAAAAATFAWQWQQGEHLNAAIARSAQGDAAVGDDETPEVELIRAQLLSGSGATEAAIKTYKTLASNQRNDIREAALLNLGNLYLRQALQNGAAEAPRFMPLIELAKQSYRNLLRINSQDWDARYNLEQALRLAPEFDDVTADDGESLVPKERAITTMQGQKLDLP